ncbi:tyrosine-type recombinase/integrase [Streptomyces sp. NPDC059575]|uniref:tyrosine-type recombinase/integrase n=1 Tax=Streptomyces sp. NPDC059575 TaxID=3346872 RepID=UPI00367B1D0B
MPSDSHALVYPPVEAATPRHPPPWKPCHHRPLRTIPRQWSFLAPETLSRSRLESHYYRPVRTRPTLSRAFSTLLRKAGLRRIRFHDLRHSTATLHLEQGVELAVIKELLGHAHIGVTATVYAHVRLRLQRDAIDSLSTALGSPKTAEASAPTATNRHPAPPSSTDVAVNYCRHPMQKPRQDAPDGASGLQT